MEIWPKAELQDEIFWFFARSEGTKSHLHVCSIQPSWPFCSILSRHLIIWTRLKPHELYELLGLWAVLGIFMALKVTATFWHVFFLPQNRHELGRYPAKDYATYWECEEYTKAWGHGSKENPQPLNSVPREKGPMRDRIWFREPTTIPRLPKSLEPVPNK